MASYMARDWTAYREAPERPVRAEARQHASGSEDDVSAALAAARAALWRDLWRDAAAARELREVLPQLHRYITRHKYGRALGLVERCARMLQRP